jgi:hypothetical protein
MGPERIELSPNGLKVRYAAGYTTAPMFHRGYAFKTNLHFGLLNFQSGSPEDRTQRGPHIRREWATSPRLPLSKSDTSESNRDPPAPKAGVLPSAPVSDVVFAFSSPCGSRTLPVWREKPVTSPEVERTISFSSFHLLAPLQSVRTFSASGPGGARILVCGSSDRR